MYVVYKATNTLCKGNITRSGYKMYTEKSQETIENIA